MLATHVLAQSWRAFEVAPAEHEAAIRAAGGGFERTWNELLVTVLRAQAAREDSARHLLALARSVAEAEARALGSTIGRDALMLLARWDERARADRVRAAVQESLGVAAQGERRWADSDTALVAALTLYERLGERRRRAWVLGTLGSGPFLTGDYARADSLYRLALAARRAIGDSALVGRALNTLGSIAQQRSRNEEALRWYTQARRVRTQLGDRGALATTLTYMSMAAQRTGHADSALVWLPQALDLAVAVGDSTRTAGVLVVLAAFRADQGNATTAEALARRALAIAEQPGQPSRTLLEARHVLGRCLVLSGRFNDAASMLEGTAGSAREMGDMRTLAMVQLTLGSVWLQVEDPQRARQALRLADSLGLALDDPGIRVGALNNLCIVHQLDGDAARALRAGLDALGEAVRLGDSTLVCDVTTSLGDVARSVRDLEAAGAWYARAAAANVDPGGATWIACQNNIAAVASERGRLDESGRAFRAALDRAVEARLPEQSWHAMLGLGDVAERRERFDEALAWYRQAAAVIDTLRAGQREERSAITFFSNRLFAYEALVHLLGKLEAREPGRGHDAEAFAWAERARARSLLDLLQSSGRADVPSAPLSLEQARRLLTTDDQALLVFSTGDSSSTGWVVTRRGSQRYVLPPARALRPRVESLRLTLARPGGWDTERAHTASQATWDLLVRPALPSLERVRRIVIVPDGPLSLLPFEALENRERDGRTRFLVERFDITYAPSVTSITDTPGASKCSDCGILALGDPAFDTAKHPELVTLPGTRFELESLRSLAGKRSFTALVGAKATRSALLADPLLARSDILHLATHGVADASEPSRSGLWFAAEDSATSFLSAVDVASLHLDARLVVLSACESGLGRLERGEGVLGLPRAFIASGAGSVVMSLWKVPDHSTSSLMSTFYENLLRRGQARDRALAEVKRAQLRAPGTRDPMNWAPFVLFGAWGTLGR